MTEPVVAVIGAGMAGLACARQLFAARQSVTVFEKSRGLGGRLATRRVGRLAFDHGAQYVIARDAQFADYLDLACAAGYAQNWVPVAPGLSRVEPWVVGTPGMSAIVQPLAAGLDVRRGLKVMACAYRDQEWWLRSESGEELGPYSALVFAVPAPQAIDLTRELAVDIDVSQALKHVRMAPCWAVMVGFPGRFDTSTDVLMSNEGPLTWVARDTGKAGRKSPHDCWVLQASPEWTREHLDDPAGEVAAALLTEFAAFTGPTPAGAWVSAHLWRYARVEQPLGEPCIWDPDRRLGFCGDWCLDGRVEAAWLSGTALAQHLLHRD